MSSLIREIIKAYFVAVSLFGFKATHLWLVSQFPKYPPKMSSLSDLNRQLIGDREFKRINCELYGECQGATKSKR